MGDKELLNRVERLEKDNKHLKEELAVTKTELSVLIKILSEQIKFYGEQSISTEDIATYRTSTDTNRKYIKLLAEGHTNNEIIDIVSEKPSAVRSRIVRLRVSYNCKTREELTKKAIKIVEKIEDETLAENNYEQTKVPES